MTPQEQAHNIVNEAKAAQERIHNLAKQLNVTYEKALSLIKAEERARAYRKQQQELAKKARKTAEWKTIFQK
jgi:polysaccharide deacetylase 2 family uncharacterized protein YibQ